MTASIVGSLVLDFALCAEWKSSTSSQPSVSARIICAAKQLTSAYVESHGVEKILTLRVGDAMLRTHRASSHRSYNRRRGALLVEPEEVLFD